MYLTVDVQYGETAKIAGVVFARWDAQTPVATYVTELQDVEPYVPGEFYRRELPCIKHLLTQVKEPISCLIVDGHCWLESNHPGLGEIAHRELGLPVIGIAKTIFKNGIAVPVVRGSSTKPLYVSTSGCTIDPQAVQAMHGPYRIPTLLKLVDRLARA